MATYKLRPQGFRALGQDGASISIVNDGNKERPQVFAGPGAVGMLDPANDVALPYSFQFGTTPAESNMWHTTFSAPGSFCMESGGTDPNRVIIDAGGNQSCGYGRYKFNYKTKAIRLEVRPEDALVASCPRAQLNSHHMLHRAGYHRFTLDFTLGDDDAPWPPFAAGYNTVLLFQLKGATFPSFSAQIRDAASGNKKHRDLYFLRRLANSGYGSGGFDSYGENRVAIVRDIRPGRRYTFYIDMYMDWAAPESGGNAYTCIWHHGKKIALHADVGGGTELRDPTIFGPAAPGTYYAMWGLYCSSYYNIKSPYTWAIILHDCRIEHFHDKPPSLSGISIRNPVAPEVDTTRGTR